MSHRGSRDPQGAMSQEPQLRASRKLVPPREVPCPAFWNASVKRKGRLLHEALQGSPDSPGAPCQVPTFRGRPEPMPGLRGHLASHQRLSRVGRPKASSTEEESRHRDMHGRVPAHQPASRPSTLQPPPPEGALQACLTLSGKRPRLWAASLHNGLGPCGACVGKGQAGSGPEPQPLAPVTQELCGGSFSASLLLSIV